jgi:hypothetical protein
VRNLGAAVPLVVFDADDCPAGCSPQRGILCDIIGRRWCFNITCLIASVFGLIFAAPSNYSALCFVTACIGFGVGGRSIFFAWLRPPTIGSCRS